MKTHYFTVTDEDGRTAGILKASTSKQLESFLMDLTIEHHVLDDAELQNSLLINDFIGQDNTIIVKGIIDGDDEPTYYDMRLESCLVYGEPNYFQVLNASGNPASNELDDECIFSSEEKAKNYIEYLVVECNLNKEDFKIIEL